MTQDRVRKADIRAVAEATNEPYTVAARIAAATEQAAEAIAAADQVDYDPVFYAARTTSTIPPILSRRMSLVSGAAEDCYALAVADPTTEGGPDGTLAVIARAVAYRGLPALLLEAVEVTEAHTRLPGLWHNAWSIQLYERGWRYDIGAPDTSRWTLTLTPGPDPSAPVHVEVADTRDGYRTFSGEALLSPGWLARAQLHPAGLALFAGPCAGVLPPTPDEWSDEFVNDLLATADLTWARIPVVLAQAVGH